MNTMQALGRLIAAACALAASVYSTDASAANVGVYGNCSSSAATMVTAAGHTPVTVATLTASSLNGLSVLLDNTCGYSANAAVDAAVANGMTLIVHDWSSRQHSQLPGRPAVIATEWYGADLEIPAGSPVTTGVGGTLTATSLDGGNWSTHGVVTAGSLPAGGRVLLSSPSSSEAVTFAYPHGTGRVVYSMIPLQWYFPGGSGSGGATGPGMRAYAQNLIAWVAGPSFTTCAAEGFSGGKLTMCQKICEIDQTPSMLTSLIRLYRAAYREDPPCAN